MKAFTVSFFSIFTWFSRNLSYPKRVDIKFRFNFLAYHTQLTLHEKIIPELKTACQENEVSLMCLIGHLVSCTYVHRRSSFYSIQGEGIVNRRYVLHQEAVQG